MKLFKVVPPKGEPQFFADKVEAKRLRDLTPGTVVSRGPDHGRGESFNRNLNPTPATSRKGW